MINYQPIIGLEIHIELKTKSKMFCSCLADYFGHEPNTHCCPTCLGLPGALPVANKKAVEWTVMAGIALGCQIPLFSKFDRKNYFYPDLPKGYQISQYDLPFAVNGKLKLQASNSKLQTVRIRRVHLEEDTAKMIHTKDSTLLDFNRSGVPLMEIVTEPDVRSVQEAREFVKKLQQIIRYLGISDCDMEKGTMRIEPNISIIKESRKAGISGSTLITEDQLPKYKVEVKNINSVRFMEKAIDYEINRQIQLIEAGELPKQETRGWDEVKQVTFTQRVKEGAADYRYFPEPDLPPIRWKESDLEKIRNQIPELPDDKINRFISQFNLLKSQAEILSTTKERADYYEESVKLGKEHNLTPTQISNVIINKKVDVDRLLPAELIKILAGKKTQTKLPPEDLEKTINEVIKENQKAVEDYKKGKATVVEFLVGQVQAKTRGLADPNSARLIITKKLSHTSVVRKSK